MITLDQFRTLALAFPNASEEPHFEKTSFRIKKRIFATYDQKKHIACVKLSEADQDIFSLIDPAVIYPVPNKWGKQGWTLVAMDKVDLTVFEDVLSTAYQEVAAKRK